MTGAKSLFVALAVSAASYGCLTTQAGSALSISSVPELRDIGARSPNGIELAQAQVMTPGDYPTFDPSLEMETNISAQVNCVCIREDGNLLALHPGDEMLDPIKRKVPFLARISGGPTCQAVCSANGSRCVGGVVEISSYTPGMVSTNSNAPGIIYVHATFSRVSRRDCQ